MITPMVKVLIAGPRSSTDDLLSALISAESLHPIPPNENRNLISRIKIGSAIDEKSEEALLKKGEAALSKINESLIRASVSSKEYPVNTKSLINDPSSDDWLSDATFMRIKYASDAAITLTSRLKQVDEEKRLIKGYRLLFERFLPLIETVASSHTLSLIGVTLTDAPEESRKETSRLVSEVTGGAYEIAWADDEDLTLAALIIVPKKFREVVIKKALGAKVKPVHIPERYRGKSFAQTLKKFLAIKRRLTDEGERLNDWLSKWKESTAPALIKAKKEIDKRLWPLRVRQMATMSDKTVWITGWVPETKISELKKRLSDELAGAISITTIDTEDNEQDVTPVLLTNNKATRPFELLMRLYGLPLYGSFDPTWLIAITLPLFYGAILGDVGYAALLLLFGLSIRRYFKGNLVAEDISSIAYTFAGSSAIFGVIYGEVFGDFFHRLDLIDPTFNREDGALFVMLVVILAGGAHLAIGSTIALYLAAKRGVTLAVVEKSADLIFFLSAAWGATHLMNMSITTAHVTIPLLALFVKACAGGLAATLLETPRMVSNILSYIRIMALGLASLILADMANEVGAKTAIFGIVIAAALHGANFLLALLSPTIQSVRLHFVEFFGQFYQSGAVPFTPLKEH